MLRTALLPDVAGRKFLRRRVTRWSTIEFVISDPAVAERLLLSVSSSPVQNTLLAFSFLFFAASPELHWIKISRINTRGGERHGRPAAIAQACLGFLGKTKKKKKKSSHRNEQSNAGASRLEQSKRVTIELRALSIPGGGETRSAADSACRGQGVRRAGRATYVHFLIPENGRSGADT